MKKVLIVLGALLYGSSLYAGEHVDRPVDPRHEAVDPAEARRVEEAKRLKQEADARRVADQKAKDLADINSRDAQKTKEDTIKNRLDKLNEEFPGKFTEQELLKAADNNKAAYELQNKIDTLRKEGGTALPDKPTPGQDDIGTNPNSSGTIVGDLADAGKSREAALLVEQLADSLIETGNSLNDISNKITTNIDDSQNIARLIKENEAAIEKVNSTRVSNEAVLTENAKTTIRLNTEKGVAQDAVDAAQKKIDAGDADAISPVEMKALEKTVTDKEAAIQSNEEENAKLIQEDSELESQLKEDEATRARLKENKNKLDAAAKSLEAERGTAQKAYDELLVKKGAAEKEAQKARNTVNERLAREAEVLNEDRSDDTPEVPETPREKAAKAEAEAAAAKVEAEAEEAAVKTAKEAAAKVEKDAKDAKAQEETDVADEAEAAAEAEAEAAAETSAERARLVDEEKAKVKAAADALAKAKQKVDENIKAYEKDVISFDAKKIEAELTTVQQQVDTTTKSIADNHTKLTDLELKLVESINADMKNVPNEVSLTTDTLRAELNEVSEKLSSDQLKLEEYQGKKKALLENQKGSAEKVLSEDGKKLVSEYESNSKRMKVVESIFIAYGDFESSKDQSAGGYSKEFKDKVIASLDSLNSDPGFKSLSDEIKTLLSDKDQSAKVKDLTRLDLLTTLNEYLNIYVELENVYVKEIVDNKYETLLSDSPLKEQIKNAHEQILIEEKAAQEVQKKSFDQQTKNINVAVEKNMKEPFVVTNLAVESAQAALEEVKKALSGDSALYTYQESLVNAQAQIEILRTEQARIKEEYKKNIVEIEKAAGSLAKETFLTDAQRAAVSKELADNKASYEASITALEGEITKLQTTFIAVQAEAFVKDPAYKALLENIKIMEELKASAPAVKEEALVRFKEFLEEMAPYDDLSKFENKQLLEKSLKNQIQQLADFKQNVAGLDREVSKGQTSLSSIRDFIKQSQSVLLEHQKSVQALVKEVNTQMIQSKTLSPIDAAVYLKELNRPLQEYNNAASEFKKLTKANQLPTVTEALQAYVEGKGSVDAALASCQRENDVYRLLSTMESSAAAVRDQVMSMMVGGGEGYVKADVMDLLNKDIKNPTEHITKPNDPRIGVELQRISSLEYVQGIASDPKDVRSKIVQEKLGEGLLGTSGGLSVEGTLVFTDVQALKLKENWNKLPAEAKKGMAEPISWTTVTPTFLQEVGDAWLKSKKDLTTLSDKRVVCEALKETVIEMKENLTGQPYRDLGANALSSQLAYEKYLNYYALPGGKPIPFEVNAKAFGDHVTNYATQSGAYSELFNDYRSFVGQHDFESRAAVQYVNVVDTLSKKTNLSEQDVLLTLQNLDMQKAGILGGRDLTDPKVADWQKTMVARVDALQEACKRLSVITDPKTPQNERTKIGDDVLKFMTEGLALSDRQSKKETLSPQEAVQLQIYNDTKAVYKDFSAKYLNGKKS